MNQTVDKNWTIAQVLAAYPAARAVFAEWGFMCVDCPSSSLESLELGTRLHGIDTAEFLAALNARVNTAEN